MKTETATAEHQKDFRMTKKHSVILKLFFKYDSFISSAAKRVGPFFSRLTYDPYWAKNGTYFSACSKTSDNVLYSPFCRCIKLYKQRSEDDVRYFYK
jgi:hypothetical protein